MNNAFCTVYIHETALRREMKPCVMSAVDLTVKDSTLQSEGELRLNDRP
jgi:hypothetical protein